MTHPLILEGLIEHGPERSPGEMEAAWVYAETITRQTRYGRRPQQHQGIFYVVQLVPELDAQRIKFGFSSRIKARLAGLRITCPNAQLLKSWPCRRSWESTAIDSLTQENRTMGMIGGEVFRCTDIEDLLLRGDAFFATMSS